MFGARPKKIVDLYHCVCMTFTYHTGGEYELIDPNAKLMIDVCALTIMLIIMRATSAKLEST
jgi:hypothetical protein